MAALAFQSITVDMLISWWRRALGLSWHGWRSFFAAQLEPELPPERPSFSSISLIQAGHDSLRLGPALNK
jgi:hypothetical protein